MRLLESPDALEALGLLANKLSLQGGVWNGVAMLNDNLGNAGFVVVALFIACWGISLLNYRWKGYDALEVR